jgi:hypothetical protein
MMILSAELQAMAVVSAILAMKSRPMETYD